MQKKKTPKQTTNIHLSGNYTNALVSFMQVCLCKFSILSKKKKWKITNPLENAVSHIYLFIYLKAQIKAIIMCCRELYFVYRSLYLKWFSVLSVPLVVGRRFVPPFLFLLFIYLIKWPFKQGSSPFISLCPQIQEKKLSLGTFLAHSGHRKWRIDWKGVKF